MIKEKAKVTRTNMRWVMHAVNETRAVVKQEIMEILSREVIKEDNKIKGF